MVKKKKHINLHNENMDEVLEDVWIEDISMEEIDEEMKDFYIDEEKIENIKYSFDKESFIKDVIDKADKDISKKKVKKTYIKIAASIVVLLCIGIYNPVLAYKVPSIMAVLEKVNDVLKVDEISTTTQLDTIIPKAIVENDKIKLVKITRYKVKKDNSKEESTKNNNLIVYDEYGVVNFIHKMSNQIINAADGKKFGIVNINPQNIEIALNSVKNIKDKEARNYLREELKKWQKGDFENGVSVHNYVWHMLNGDIGIASSLDEEEINKIKNKYFK